MARTIIDLTGQQFKHLTAIEIIGRKNKKALWKCICRCKKEVLATSNQLRRMNTTSCGCGKRELKLAENNPMWAGDNVGRTGIHEWIRNRLPKPQLCQECKSCPPYDLANISQKYLRNLSDWEWLCRRCHMIKDGRLEKLKIRMSKQW